MLRTLLLVPLALAAVVAPGAAGSAASDAAQARERAVANTTTYTDSTGEIPAAPDLTTLTVSNDDAGTITFRAEIPNRPTLTGDMLLAVLVDSDANGATGDPASLGADYSIEVFQNQVALFAWDGTDFTRSAAGPSAATLGFSYTSGLTVRINRSELGNTSALRFAVVAVSGIVVDAAGNPNFDAAASDRAPDSNLGLYSFPVVVSTAPGAKPKPKPRYDHYRDATKLPARVRYTGSSIKHKRLGEQLYRTMRRLGVPRVVSVACWSRRDWPDVYASTGGDGNPSFISGFWHPRLPRWVHVAPKQCVDVQALMTSRQTNGQRAYALATVLHERLHAQGLENEALTECFAVQLVYDFARTLGFPHRKGMRLEQLAVRKSRALAPRGYWDARRCRDGGAWDLFDEFSNLDY